MARTHYDHVAEKIDPAEPPVGATSDINEPPKPVRVADDKLADVHSVLSQLALMVETLAAHTAGGHGLAASLARLKDGLAGIYDKAHSK